MNSWIARSIAGMVVTIVLCTGCERRAPAPAAAPANMTTEQLIVHFADTPVDQTVGLIAKSLAKRRVFLPTDAASTRPASRPAAAAASSSSTAGATTSPSSSPSSQRAWIQSMTTQETTLRIASARDKHGRMWAYAYTSEEEFLKVLPAGTPFIEMSFPHFFRMIEQDPQFAGIFLNSGSDRAMYPIPREFFDRMK